MRLFPRCQSSKGVGPALPGATSQRLGATSQGWQAGSKLLDSAKWFGRTAVRLIDLATDPLGVAFGSQLKAERAVDRPRKRINLDSDGNVICPAPQEEP